MAIVIQLVEILTLIQDSRWIALGKMLRAFWIAPVLCPSLQSSFWVLQFRPYVLWEILWVARCLLATCHVVQQWHCWRCEAKMYSNINICFKELLAFSSISFAATFALLTWSSSVLSVLRAFSMLALDALSPAIVVSSFLFFTILSSSCLSCDMISWRWWSIINCWLWAGPCPRKRLASPWYSLPNWKGRQSSILKLHEWGNVRSRAPVWHLQALTWDVTAF